MYPPGDPYGQNQGYGANPYGVPQQQPMYPMVPVMVNPQAPYGVHPNGVPYSDKTRLVAGLLGIFLGGFGAGRFYTGHTGLAIGQLLACKIGGVGLAFFTCGISLLVYLWPIIDGIVILSTDSRDARGYMLRPG